MSHKLWKISCPPFSVLFFLECICERGRVRRRRRERECRDRQTEVDLAVHLPCSISCTSLPSKHKSFGYKAQKYCPHTQYFGFSLPSQNSGLHSCSGFHLVFSCSTTPGDFSYSLASSPMHLKQYLLYFIDDCQIFFNENIFTLSSL